MASDEDGDSIKEMILEQEEAASIIKNSSLLDPNKIVSEDRIVGRDDQLMNITQYLRISVRGDRPPNLLLYGPSGTGKSLIINAVCNNLQELCQNRDISFGIIQINCQNIHTLDDAVWELIKCIKIDVPDAEIQIKEHGISTKKKWDELYRLINSHYDTVIFILDELDMLVGRRGKKEPGFSRILYQLSRASNKKTVETNVSVTAITNDTKMMENVGSRALSSFNPKEIHFTDYDANQIRLILRHRADAFYEGTLTDDVIPLAAAFAAQNHGDARRAIDLMREAGSIAERKGAAEVTESHVRSAQAEVQKNRVLEVARGISQQKQLCFFATAIVSRERREGQKVKTTDGHTVYQFLTDALGTEQYSQETFVNKMKELTTYSLVASERKSQGPSSGSYLEYTFNEDPNTIIETLRDEVSRLEDVSDEELQAVVRNILR